MLQYKGQTSYLCFKKIWSNRQSRCIDVLSLFPTIAYSDSGVGHGKKQLRDRKLSVVLLGFGVGDPEGDDPLARELDRVVADVEQYLIDSEGIRDRIFFDIMI